MKITIFSTHTLEKIVKTFDVEEYKVFLSEGNWILGIDYFDEGIEQDNTDVMALCQASSEDAYDDIFIIKTGRSGEPAELFASDKMKKILTELYADIDLMSAMCFYVSKQKLNEMYGYTVSELSKSDSAAGDKHVQISDN